MPRPRSWLRLALVAAALLAAPPSPEAFSHGGGETHARTFPSLLSDSPMRVDVHLNVTTPGVVTVALWPSGWQHPSLAFADTSGELDAASIALVRSARDALVATLPSAPSGGSHPPATLAAVGWTDARAETSDFLLKAAVADRSDAVAAVAQLAGDGGRARAVKAAEEAAAARPKAAKRTGPKRLAFADLLSRAKNRAATGASDDKEG